jgi:acyl-CoA thioesterase I
MFTNWSAARLTHTVVVNLLISACAASTPLSPQSVAVPPTPGIVVLGDSLAVSPSSTDNFVTNLQRRLEDEGHRWNVVNAGVRGAVTADGVERIDRLLSNDVRILVVELGANDGLRGIAVSTVERNLSQIIERAQKRGIQVLLCGMDTAPLRGWDYMLEFHQVFPSLANRYGTDFVPFVIAAVALNPTLSGPDGIHPNTEGARRIAAIVWPYLKSMVERNAAQPVTAM